MSEEQLQNLHDEITAIRELLDEQEKRNSGVSIVRIAAALFLILVVSGAFVYLF